MLHLLLVFIWCFLEKVILESVPDGDVCVQQSCFTVCPEDSDHCFLKGHNISHPSKVL